MVLPDSTIGLYRTPQHRHRSVLTPEQQPTRMGLRRRTDYRSQRMLKHVGRSQFHCLAEYYHAALLEGDPTVTSYTPQPFRLRVGRKSSYIPDIYYVRNGEPTVAELKPRAVFNDELRMALERFFAQYGIAFVVIANEPIYERAIAAQNWLMVVRWLLSYQELDTELERQAVLQQLLKNGEVCYGDIADVGNRDTRLAHEVAMYRMLYAGEIEADLEQRFIGSETVLRLC